MYDGKNSKFDKSFELINFFHSIGKEGRFRNWKKLDFLNTKIAN